ncbi:unnamed protein product [Cylicocyclus nassatus]|uniref:Uncharacterized protein n=1 Tax=Cylicocyclus nassatus TaxID=53992 RepID=A0AA36GDT6_CYLNA|nr:unnamed protein product [Cylicocyclus nassatus]
MNTSSVVFDCNPSISAIGMQVVAYEQQVGNSAAHPNKRAPTMSTEELIKSPSVCQGKKSKLLELGRQLVAAGYPERTTSQLDQRIRDTLRNVKKYTARQKSFCSTPTRSSAISKNNNQVTGNITMNR